MDWMTPFWSVIALLYQMTTNSAVNKNLTSVINNWNHSSKNLYTNKVIKAIFLHDQISY